MRWTERRLEREKKKSAPAIVSSAPQDLIRKVERYRTTKEKKKRRRSRQLRRRRQQQQQQQKKRRRRKNNRSFLSIKYARYILLLRSLIRLIQKNYLLWGHPLFFFDISQQIRASNTLYLSSKNSRYTRVQDTQRNSYL